MSRLCRWTVAGSVFLVGCGASQPNMPTPRPLIVTSGARLTADPGRLQEIYDWVLPMNETIVNDPSFLIDNHTIPIAAYPWESYEYVSDDTVRVGYEASAPDVSTSYEIYAYLHLLDRLGTIGDWFPEAEDLEGWELEKFIIQRTGDSWLLGRAVFDTHPYALMDELIYAQDRGYFDEFVALARGQDFPEQLAAFRAEHPDRLQAYEQWFRETFDRAPPGVEEGEG